MRRVLRQGRGPRHRGRQEVARLADDVESGPHRLHHAFLADHDRQVFFHVPQRRHHIEKRSGLEDEGGGEGDARPARDEVGEVRAAVGRGVAVFIAGQELEERDSEEGEGEEGEGIVGFGHRCLSRRASFPVSLQHVCGGIEETLLRKKSEKMKKKLLCFSFLDLEEEKAVFFSR